MRIYFDYHETDDISASIYDMTFNDIKDLIADFNECMEVDYQTIQEFNDRESVRFINPRIYI